MEIKSPKNFDFKKGSEGETFKEIGAGMNQR
jgi:hypothetical protein